MKVLLYLVFGAIGFFAMRATWDEGPPGESPSVDDGNPSISDRSGARVRLLSKSLRRFSSNEYQEAWENLPRQRLSKTQRVEAQTHLLRVWAEKDLNSALAAALEEPWHAGRYATTDDSGSLLKRALGELFVSRPDDFVELINDRSLGVLESVVLGQAFVESLGRHHPDVLEGIAPGIRNDKVGEISKRLLEKHDR